MASRIIDSTYCRECADNLQLLFTAADQAIVDSSISVKGAACRISDVLFNVAPFSATPGCCRVEATYLFDVTLECCPAGGGTPLTVTGYCNFASQVLLRGGDSGVSTFTSAGLRSTSLPDATCQATEPVLVSACLAPACESQGTGYGTPLCNADAGLVRPTLGQNTVFCSVGVFSILSLERTEPLQVPSYGYAAPLRSSRQTDPDEEPCAVFNRLSFPIGRFFPGYR
jgi:hypothetical protein